MSLRNRLLASHILLLALTLGIISFALLLLLDAQPAPRDPTYERLYRLVQDITNNNTDEQERLLADFRRRDYQYLSEYAASNEVRVMVVNLRNNTVIFDSLQAYLAGDHLRLELDLAAGAELTARGVNASTRLETLVGGLRSTDGNYWLFAGYSFSRPVLNTQTALLIADPQPTQSLQDALRTFGSSLVRPLIQAALVGGLVAFVLAALISRSIVKPLQSVVDATRRVTAGNLEMQVPVAGPPEVRAVAEGVNSMSAEVRIAQQAQRDFLANVSHDLKTPLTSIQIGRAHV